MPANIDTITGTMEFVTSTGTDLKFTYTRSGSTYTIVRHITAGPQNALLTISGIRADAAQLLKVADAFDRLSMAG